ncbi:MAG: coiled-coil domain-containing protein, partial [Candidatus Aquicultor sp.]
MLSLLASTALASQLGDKRAELRKVKAKIEANKKLQHAAVKKQADVKQEIALNLKKVGKLQLEIADMQADIRRSTSKRKFAEARLFAAQKQLKATQSALSVAEMKLAYKRETYDMRLSSIYKNGPVTILQALLNSRDLGDLLMRTSLLTTIAEHDGKMVSDMKRARKDIVRQLDEVTAQKKVIGRQRLQLVDEENHLKVVKRRLVAKQGLFKNEV